jgi:hypothetical protein
MMFKWLSRLKIWRRESQDEGPTVHEYGRYVYKPVIARALSEVIGVSQAEVCDWIASPGVDLFLNDELIQGATWARRRLESGDYEIKIPLQNKVWRFFIV